MKIKLDEGKTVKLVPTAERLLVRKLDAVKKTAAGLLLPASQNPHSCHAEILAVSPRVAEEQPHIKPGRVCIIASDLGTAQVLPDGTDAFWCDADACFAVFEPVK